MDDSVDSGLPLCPAKNVGHAVFFLRVFEPAPMTGKSEESWSKETGFQCKHEIREGEI
jgi:hypothetical protein